ncbi:hypothetical protein AB0942_02195 [Streptomyces nodosus]|uniref:hypothetical protein n=1 Tax=Streptomyces nodosus TaxID=40318 RepID=UPI003456DB8E
MCRHRAALHDPRARSGARAELVAECTDAVGDAVWGARALVTDPEGWAGTGSLLAVPPRPSAHCHNSARLHAVD